MPNRRNPLKLFKINNCCRVPLYHAPLVIIDTNLLTLRRNSCKVGKAIVLFLTNDC